jgi:hypothetical protein
VADTGLWRNHAEIAEGGLPPAQELVALVVALELQRRVGLESGDGAVAIDLHRVIDDQVDRLQRIDAGGISAQPAQCGAHGSQVSHGRYPGEILQKDPGRHELDLLVRFGRCIPPGNRFDVLFLHRYAILTSQEIFQQYLERIGKPRYVEAGIGCEGMQRMVTVGIFLHREGRDRIVAIGSDRHSSSVKERGRI